MNPKAVIFERKTYKFSNGTKCIVGTVHIADIDWNSICKEDKEKPYEISIFLPSFSLKSDFKRFKTEEEAKDMVIKVWGAWIDKVME